MPLFNSKKNKSKDTKAALPEASVRKVALSKKSAPRHASGQLRPGRTTRIGEMLIEAGYVEPRHLEAALALHRSGNKKLVACLCDLGLMNEPTFEEFLARQPGLASIRLCNYVIKEEAVGLIPKDFAMKNQVMPIDRLGKLLTVGMVCPLDIQTLREIEQLTGLHVSPLLCTLQDIRTCIDKCYASRT